MKTLYFAAGLVLLVAGCNASSTLPIQKTIHFGIVPEWSVQSDATTIALPYFGDAHQPQDRAKLSQPLLTCRVQRVELNVDHAGNPAVGVELDSRDSQAFSDFTAAHVNEALAIVVNGQVVSVATINERLPAVMQLCDSYTASEARSLQSMLE